MVELVTGAISYPKNGQIPIAVKNFFPSSEEDFELEEELDELELEEDLVLLSVLNCALVLMLNVSAASRISIHVTFSFSLFMLSGFKVFAAKKIMPLEFIGALFSIF